MQLHYKLDKQNVIRKIKCKTCNVVYIYKSNKKTIRDKER